MPRKPSITPRKPPRLTVAPPLDEARRFVEKTSERLDVLTPRHSGVDPRDSRSRRRTTVYFQLETFKRLSVRCAELDRDISDVVEEATASWLKK